MNNAYAIWYMKPEWFRDGIMGAKPDPANLKRTHTFLKSIELDGDPKAAMETIWLRLNGNFSDDSDVPLLVREKGLAHTSMSMGDVVVRDGTVYVVATVGFEEVGEIPGCDWVSHMEVEA